MLNMQLYLKYIKQLRLKLIKSKNLTMRYGYQLSGGVHLILDVLFLKLYLPQEQWSSLEFSDFDSVRSSIPIEFLSKTQHDFSLLQEIITMIDKLDMSLQDSIDYLGCVFECLYKLLGMSNNTGQFFTPPPIIDLMLTMANLQENQKLYDPFCGSGGILIKGAKYTKNLYGGEITEAAKLAAMNMFLCNSKGKIFLRDTLKHPIEHEFDVVISNIPFSLNFQNVSHLYYDGFAKNNGDGLCMLHCIKSVKKGGKMIVIVPEGFLFKNALANIRKFLMESAKLVAIISLDQGIFNPYTTVKASILYFRDCDDLSTENDILHAEANQYNIDSIINNIKSWI